jgi:hypothetical protein
MEEKNNGKKEIRGNKDKIGIQDKERNEMDCIFGFTFYNKQSETDLRKCLCV